MDSSSKTNTVVREALDFYREEWTDNGEDDGIQPTAALMDDAGGMADTALDALDEMEDERRRMSGWIRKMCEWLEGSAERSSKSAESCDFVGLRAAYLADAKNYSVMAKHGRSALGQGGENG